MHRFSLYCIRFVCVASLVACGGASETDLDDDTDLPEEFDSVAQGLDANVDPTHEASGDHDRECRRDGDGKRKWKNNRLHHLFKRLDRLDGDKDHRIVIADLPAKVPARLVEKLGTIDTDHDGIVTKREVKTAWRARKHDRLDRDDDDRDDDVRR